MALLIQVHYFLTNARRSLVRSSVLYRELGHLGHLGRTHTVRRPYTARACWQAFGTKEITVQLSLIQSSFHLLQGSPQPNAEMRQMEEKKDDPTSGCSKKLL